MSSDSTSKRDYRSQTAGKRAPRAVADALGGVIIATADVDAPPERVFDLFTTAEVERWWGHPDFYHWADWKAELRECGPWSVTVHLTQGGAVHGWGEFAAIAAPHKLVMTRRFDRHPHQGDRETTITYCFEPAAAGTRITIRDEGYIGRREAAYGNAEHWERVLGWLDAFLSERNRNPETGAVMAKVSFGNHSSVIVPKQDRDSIRKFYCDVLGGEITKGQEERDFIRLGDSFFIVLYGDVPDASEFLRTARSVWLELKSDDVDEMKRKILESGLARKLEVPDPHLYFQAPGGQCWRLVGINEDLSFYEGAAEGPNVGKLKEAVKKL